MIERIHITALKSIRDLDVKCSNLNLLVGTNSSGKSTFLQALLLLAQEKLNGEYIAIGDYREVRNYNMPQSSIKIEAIDKGKTKPTWIEFSEDKEKGNCLVRTEFSDMDVQSVIYDDCDDPELTSAISFKEFHYLSCHRVGVKDIYDKNMPNEKDFGIDGEYTLAYLLNNESVNIDEKLQVRDGDITNSMLDQVNYWLNYIIGTTISISDIKKTNYLQAKYTNNPANISQETMYCRPVNVGSGISYLISIIISCLGTESGAILLIENPEIHLHPKAQSRLCDFLWFVSKTGRQLFVETHSDHIFNGLRVAVANGSIDSEELTVNFFALNEAYETQCNPIVFGKYGKIIGINEDMCLDDLFDQFDIDLDRMLGL